MSDRTDSNDNDDDDDGGSRGGYRGGGGRSGGGGRRFFRRPRTCRFCTDKSTVLNYKEIKLLESFVNQEGKIRPRRQTGTCAKHQRAVAKAIKQSRHMALMTYTGEVLS